MIQQVFNRKALPSSGHFPVCSLLSLAWFDHQIRMKMMEKAGYAKRGDESEAGEEWITVDEDGSDNTVDRMKDAVAE